MDDTKHAAPFLAGHPALDFLNTRMRGSGGLIDVLERDDDVLNWLKKAHFRLAAGGAFHFEAGALLDCARRIREAIRSLIEKRMAGRRGDPAILNDFLGVPKATSGWFGANRAN